MKKITLAIFLMVYSFGNSQEFPLNFSLPAQLMAGVGGATTSFVPDPIDAANQVLQVTGNGAPYDTAQLTLGANINLADDANNTITFRVRPAADYGTRSHLLKFESVGAGGGAASTELAFTTTGTAWQTITLNYPAGLGNYGLVVLFPDFNNNAVGTYFFDDFAGGTNIAPPAPAAAPTVNSPVPPARVATDVISIYSDAYTNISPINLDAGWCGSSSIQATTAGGAGNNVLAYKANACQGIAFPTATQNLTGFTNIHVDLFVATGTSIVGKVFNLKTVATTGGGAGEVEVPIDLGALSPAIVPGTWYSFDKAYTAGQLAAIAANPIMKEFGITSNLNNVVWYDNLYLWRAPLSTSDFSANAIKLYPNPATNVLNIESASTIEKVAIYNLLGQEVISQTPNSELVTIDVTNLQSGIYVVKSSINGNVSSTRFIKE